MMYYGCSNNIATIQGEELNNFVKIAGKTPWQLTKDQFNKVKIPVKSLPSRLNKASSNPNIYYDSNGRYYFVDTDNNQITLSYGLSVYILSVESQYNVDYRDLRRQPTWQE